MNILIRPETPDDVDRIHRIIACAFRDAPHTDHTEHHIVSALRSAGALTLSSVAEISGELVGHVALSPVTVTDGSSGWYGLGPVSVLPKCQDHGIGSMLIRHALTELENFRAKGCVVLGEPDFYTRFGFRQTLDLVFPGAPPEYFQALIWRGATPMGEVAYHPAFYKKYRKQE